MVLISVEDAIGINFYDEYTKSNNIYVGRINSKPVSQYSKDDILIASFRSMNNASKITGIDRQNIEAVASGRNKLAGGFIWKYDKKEPKE
jgi:hypothetical protein